MTIIFLCIILLAFVLILHGYTTIRFPVKRKDGKAHIACVGDSITYGCTLPMFFLRRYPAVLQQLLGQDVQVASFALNDRTLQDFGNKPFRKERAFQQSKKFLPEVVIILLGTNDSKDNNWLSAEAFREQYTTLIAEYRRLSSKPRILVCTPPCAFQPVCRFFFITNDANLERIPKVAEEVKTVAESEAVELVDLFARTADHRNLFGADGLHPSVEGAREIAKVIYRKLEAPPAGKEFFQHLLKNR